MGLEMNVTGFGSPYLPNRPAYDLGSAQGNGAKAPSSPSAQPLPNQAQKSPSDAELKEFKDDLLAYQAQQEASGDYPAIQMLIPANERGYVAIPSADQQKLINAIIARHQGDAELQNPTVALNKTALWKELTKEGVNSDQIASGAKFFYSPDGTIVDRRTATTGVDRMA